MHTHSTIRPQIRHNQRTNEQGLSEAQVKEVVEKKIAEMGLKEYADRNASTYSGGNKRKLSVAMAMIGRPLIVFLDGACGLWFELVCMRGGASVWWW